MVCILEDVLKIINYRVMFDKLIRLYDYIDDVKLLVRIFFDKKILVINLLCECVILEDYFFSVVRRV